MAKKLSYLRIFFGSANFLASVCLVYDYIISRKHVFHGYYSCDSNESVRWEDFLTLIVLIIGVFASFLRHKILELIYLSVVLVATIAFTCHSLFMIVLMPHRSPEDLRIQAVDGKWLEQYNPLLRRAIINQKKWNHMNKCYADIHLCDSISNEEDSMKGEYYLKFGCCFPPRRCGVLEANGTFQETSTTNIPSEDEECLEWQNLGRKDCYECDSCKAGSLAAFHNDWQMFDDVGEYIFGILLLVSILICAFWTFDDHQWEEFDVEIV